MILDQFSMAKDLRMISHSFEKKNTKTYRVASDKLGTSPDDEKIRRVDNDDQDKVSNRTMRE